jgi:hypothetical protein
VKRVVGLLGWLGVVLVLAAVALRFIRPEMQEWTQRLAMAGLVVVGLYALSQWRDIGRSFQGRNVRYGSIAAGSVALFLAILVGVNWIANRQNKRWDFTEGGQFSLSDQTRQILRGLDKPVAIKAFYRSTDGSETRLRDQLDQYGYESTGLISASADRVDDRQAVRSAMARWSSSRRAHRTRHRVRRAEPDNALKKVIEGRPRRSTSCRGMGARPDRSNVEGFSGIADGPGATTSRSGDHTDSGRQRADATVLVVAGPKADR